MTFVVDSSFSLSWCFEDERTPATKALLERVGDSGAHVPQHWPLEVLNGLRMAERRQRIGTAKRQRLADFLRDLPITLDTETTAQLWNATQRLAERFRLHGLRRRLSRTGAAQAPASRHARYQDMRSAGAALGVPLLGRDPA